MIKVGRREIYSRDFTPFKLPQNTGRRVISDKWIQFPLSAVNWWDASNNASSRTRTVQLKQKSRNDQHIGYSYYSTTAVIIVIYLIYDKKNKKKDQWKVQAELIWLINTWLFDCSHVNQFKLKDPPLISLYRYINAHRESKQNCVWVKRIHFNIGIKQARGKKKKVISL